MRSITFVQDVVIPHDSIRMLLAAKSAILENNSLSIPVFQTSNIIAAVKIDDLVSAMMTMETNISEYKRNGEENKRLREMEDDLFGDYALDDLPDARKEEIRTMVERWEKEDGDDE